ncbi:MAG: hypothetical protein OEU54_06505 [Gemmatimonadota bacterium]|nr:hypothetical protein [Gemmatimonadota bacterium]
MRGAVGPGVVMRRASGGLDLEHPLIRRVLYAVTGLVALYVVWLALFYRYHFLDGVNLLIHEAGHVVFSPLGEVASVWGGTLLQLAFPLAFVVYFARRRQRVEAGLTAVWAAESLMYTAEYMGDAVRQELPLVGGHIHDWNYLLDRIGLLGAAEGLAALLHILASLGAIVAVFTVFMELKNRSS